MDIILILLMIVLSSIAFQDFKRRLVDIFSLVSFIILCIVYSYFHYGITATLHFALFPFLFIFLQLTTLTIFYSLKEGKVISIFDTKLGWGDIIFWIGLCFIFSIFNYIIFFVFSIILVLTFSFLKRLKTIPLAGGQAIVLSFFLITNKFFFKIDTYDDLYFINLLF